jgi:hypothetical protein
VHYKNPRIGLAAASEASSRERIADVGRVFARFAAHITHVDPETRECIRRWPPLAHPRESDGCGRHGKLVTRRRFSRASGIDGAERTREILALCVRDGVPLKCVRELRADRDGCEGLV